MMRMATRSLNRLKTRKLKAVRLLSTTRSGLRRCDRVSISSWSQSRIKRPTRFLTGTTSERRNDSEDDSSGKAVKRSSKDRYIIRSLRGYDILEKDKALAPGHWLALELWRGPEYFRDPADLRVGFYCRV